MTSPTELSNLTANSPAEVVGDVETRGTERHLSGLLGLALTWAGAPQALYVQFNEWEPISGTLQPTHENGLVEAVRAFLAGRRLIGHNIEYDRGWIDACFEMKTEWHADTRILWHLSDKLQIQRGYGLKTAQKTLLGWKESNDGELEEAVKKAGGSLKNGDHYLAPTYLLAKYACLDVEATLQLYFNRKPFFDANDYWHFADWIRDYGALLERSTREGVLVDEVGLRAAKKKFEEIILEASQDVRLACAKEIADIEADWKVEDSRTYKTQRGLHMFLSGKGRPPRLFNPNSAQQRNLLFHEKLGFPVEETTDSGQPKSDYNALKRIKHPAAEILIRLRENEKLLEFTEGYIKHARNGRIHFPLNWCATVSGRLGGFAPYCLNMPFECEEIMRCFRLPEGTIGIHADFTSVEPAIMGALSGDETLLKVFRDGLGDVYLDLAREIFPEDRDLQESYDPQAPVTEEIKTRFKKQRSVAKIAKLAMDYTGTEQTIAKNLTMSGFPTTEEEARYIVNRHNDLFWKVKVLERKLKNLHERNGSVRNILGRIIYVPQEFRKDTLNRVVQSSAHDVLIAWVKEIYSLAFTRSVIMKAVLPDIHDFTSWFGSKDAYPAMRAVFEDALRNVNGRLNLPVTIKAVVKQFSTFYGLKNRE